MVFVNPKISVIITNLNGEQFLIDCLNSLAAQTFKNFETILVDNHSSDRSIDIVNNWYPEVILIRNDTNRGFAEATNQGIRNSQGEFILTLNNDTKIHSDFLSEILRPMDDDPKVGICASKMLFLDGRINSTGLCIARSGAAWNRGNSERDSGQYNKQEEVFGASAGAALYRRSMLDEIGLFDEDFFMYMEDVDLSFRARLAGWKCMYVPTAIVDHYHGGTAGFGSDLAVYYGNRNILWMVLKNFPSRTLLFSMPMIIGRNAGVSIYYAFHGKGRVIFRAKMDALGGIRIISDKRKMIHQNTTYQNPVARWIQPWHINKEFM